MRNEEKQIQYAVINYIRANYPNTLFTIAPNGFKLPIGVAVQLKRMGYSAGTPDIIVLEPRSMFHGLFIELKSEKGRLSFDQLEWLRKLTERDYKAVVCHGYDEAVDSIKKYLLTPKNNY